MNNIDIEVMCLVLGIGKTAMILETSEEALHIIMSNFSPNNEKFFLFINDCLLSFINKIGKSLAEERLGLSSSILEILFQTEEPALMKKQKNEKFCTGYDKQLAPLDNFSEGFKKNVLRFYYEHSDIELTAKKFSITTDLIITWVKNISTII